MLVRQAKADAAAVGRCEHMWSAEGVTLRRCGEVPMRTPAHLPCSLCTSSANSSRLWAGVRESSLDSLMAFAAMAPRAPNERPSAALRGENSRRYFVPFILMESPLQVLSFASTSPMGARSNSLLLF